MHRLTNEVHNDAAIGESASGLMEKVLAIGWEVASEVFGGVDVVVRPAIHCGVSEYIQRRHRRCISHGGHSYKNRNRNRQPPRSPHCRHRQLRWQSSTAQIRTPGRRFTSLTEIFEQNLSHP